MNTNELLAFADEQGYSVIYDDFPECGSLSTDADGYAVGIDKHLNSRDERTRLAHELGHCETGSFYSRYIKVQCRKQLENKADRWAFERLVPAEDIQSALNNGIFESWDLAEHFGVTDEFMIKALQHYTGQKGIVFSTYKEDYF
ncbi:MAG: ImmA/IrrE family metallo-endopeptidase [Oscillospiraceae bacterium]|jgi:Zn-dependent peptidase ImmA (M78 family)|nr:ImmA/IrrE family metallo-endopeptidase [Oscillospiraceae bacterium]